LEAFFEKLEKEKKASTVLSYRRDLESLSYYLAPKILKEANPEDLRGYFHRQAKRMSSSSFARALCVARKYYAHLKEQSIRSDNPMDAIRTKDFLLQEGRFLENDDFAKLLGSSFFGIRGRRDFAMLSLLCETGMQVSELVELNRKDLFLEERFLFCGKEHRRRKVFLSDRTVKLLRETVLFSQLQSGGEEAVFLGSTGKRLTRQGFWKNLKDRAIVCGVENCTPQTLRLSLAKMLLKDGKKREEVRLLLGNRGDAVLRKYEKQEKGKEKWDC